MKILKKGSFAHPISVTPDDTIRLEWHKTIRVGKLKRTFKRTVLAESRIGEHDTYDSWVIFSIDGEDKEFDSNSGIGGAFLNREGKDPWKSELEDIKVNDIENAPGWAQRLWKGISRSDDVEEV